MNLERYEWFRVGMTFARPIITALIWYAVDKVARSMHRHTKFIDRLIAKGSGSQLGRAQLEARAKTFRGLFIQFIRIITALFFLFILLESFGVDIKPLLAGIGVVGLGLSLAAQNILRDFINGMFILIEDQFNVGDFISTNGISGTVEGFSMRLTRLRLLDGSLVTIPNGSIMTVTNSTKDYSVAVVTIPSPYEAPPERMVEVLRRCGARLREEMPDKIIADPVVQGVVEFRSDDVLMRMIARTYPGEHWGAERALRSIILDEFAKEGLSIPYSHMIVSDGR